MLHRKRFELALERVQPSEWERFEQLASAFHTSEFPGLRTIATPSGDGGRDAELYSPEGETKIVFQYSVTKNWKKKIGETAKKIKSNLPQVTTLIYVSNQKIGALADIIKTELRKDFSLVLDVRDANFFLDRFEGDANREVIAANFSRVIVDAYLESKEVIDRKAQALTPGENRAALVFLEMQWHDDTRDKGLTKTAFDGLVRTALRHTNSEKRLTYEAVLNMVSQILTERDSVQVKREVDKALTRLTKHHIRHFPTTNEYCLTHEESERLKARLADIDIEDQNLQAEFLITLKTVLNENDSNDDSLLEKMVTICRASLEKYLLQRGELFVSALQNGQLHRLGFDVVRKIVESELKLANLAISPQIILLLPTVVERVLTTQTVVVEKYLRGLSDTYTLLAFLRETPDVQNAVQKMFSSGEIWLDTSLLLPLFAEELLPKEKWQFRRLINTAREAGLKFKVTRGVIEEVERHMNRSAACAAIANSSWRGSYPYLFAFYIANGSAQSSFSAWLSIFRGEARPEDDIEDFLLRVFGIVTADITLDANKADDELKYAVKEVWSQIHMERRNRAGQEMDPMLTARLAEHDTENYVGSIMRRRHVGDAALGFTCWWLTLDHMAFDIHNRLKPHLQQKSPPSPVMSADFLTNYLSFGPLRTKVARSGNEILPVALDSALFQNLSTELVQIAASVRNDAEALPEHVICRKVRDALDSAKRRTGDLTKRGLDIQIAEADLVA